ncbi:MAG TPA: hypothetical protein VK174_07245 [Chitinophagales bacterium]|nr:hypothetical protein [Chitinophagales bacterium]
MGLMFASRLNAFAVRYNKYILYLYIPMVIAFLLPVWLNPYFVTLDGSCHLYNAGILRDMLLHRNTELFSRFYELNRDYSPNWFSHIALATLLNFFSPSMAEKVLVSGYVIGFALFAWLLVKQIRAENKALAFLAFTFIYTYVLQKGFYNFSFGLVFMMAAVWVHLKYYSHIRLWLFILIQTLLLTTTYFVHPFGYLLAVAILGSMPVFGIAQASDTLRLRLHKAAKEILVVSVAALPSIAMLLYFLTRRSGEATFPNTDTAEELWDVLHKLTGIVNLTRSEEPYAAFVFYLFTVLLIVGVIVKIYQRTLTAYDAIFAVAMGMVLFYFKAPSGFAGGGMINQRLQIIPFVILLFWFASVEYPKWVTAIASTAAIVVSLCLLFIRLPVHAQASELAEEYVSAQAYIKPNATLLPLSYDHYGFTKEGKRITDGIWIFLHTADYIGAGKPLIMLGNYEAATTHFPLTWKPEKNPFTLLSINAGIEGAPPCVDIAGYKQRTGERIDFIMLLCYTGGQQDNGCVQSVAAELKANYSLVYTSVTGRVKLYSLK